MAHEHTPSPAGAPQGFVPPRPNPPLAPQPNVRPPMPPMPPAGANGGAPIPGRPQIALPGMGAPMPAQGGVPFTIICPEGYLPVVKFIKVPERTPREQGGPADPAQGDAPAAAPSTR